MIHVFLHNLDIEQPKGGRIFYHDVALFIESPPLGGIVKAWLDLCIRVRIGEIKRADFTAILAFIKLSSFSSTKNLTCIGRLRFLLSGIWTHLYSCGIFLIKSGRLFDMQLCVLLQEHAYKFLLLNLHLRGKL